MTLLGIDIGGTSIKFGLILSGNIIHSTEISSKVAHTSQFTELLSHKIKELSYENNIEFIGIGFPGTVTDNGNVISAPNLKFLEQENLYNIIQSITNIPFAIENDAFLAAYSEAKSNSLEEYYFITLGTGVGSALIKNGEIIKSINGSSGEVGHIILDLNDVGEDYRTGVFEKYFNSSAFVEYAKKDIELFPNSFLNSLDNFSVREISDGVMMGDDLCILTFIEMGKILGIGLSSVANMSGIPIFVIGGGLSNANELLYSTARKQMEKRVIPELVPYINIQKSKQYNSAGILGAALYAKDKLCTKN